jgi:hypothetical protein
MTDGAAVEGALPGAAMMCALLALGTTNAATDATT